MSEPKLPPWAPGRERVGNAVIRILSALNIWADRMTGGKIGGRFRGGAPVCLVAMYRDYDDYPLRTDREISVVVLDPVA